MEVRTICLLLCSVFVYFMGISVPGATGIGVLSWRYFASMFWNIDKIIIIFMCFFFT